jgi:aldehyde:ferredoxin oxidoreductase
MGPVTAVEYESRSELYDSQLVDILGLEPENLSTEEKMAKLREYRESQYELLLDAVYKRRGWDNDSVPTVEKLRELKMDLPEVVEVVEAAKVQE